MLSLLLFVFLDPESARRLSTGDREVYTPNKYKQVLNIPALGSTHAPDMRASISSIYRLDGACLLKISVWARFLYASTYRSRETKSLTRPGEGRSTTITIATTPSPVVISPTSPASNASACVYTSRACASTLTPSAEWRAGRPVRTQFRAYTNTHTFQKWDTHTCVYCSTRLWHVCVHCSM